VKIVLDTNVLIAAHASHGLAGAVFELCLREKTIIISPEILRELADGLLKKIGTPPSIAASIIVLLHRTAEVHKPMSIPTGSCRDADDLHILGLAVAAHADRVITGDGDLPVLGSFRGIPIVSPRQFWDAERRPKPLVQESGRRAYGRSRTAKRRT
jgi:putative PIN family toxin of toxin-antitoxin system